MASHPWRTTILMCMLAGLVSVTMMLFNQSELFRRSSSHHPEEFQDKFIKTDIDLQVPAPLQSFIQRGDLNLRPTVEELRIPESLRTSTLGCPNRL